MYVLVIKVINVTRVKCRTILENGLSKKCQNLEVTSKCLLLKYSSLHSVKSITIQRVPPTNENLALVFLINDKKS